MKLKAPLIIILLFTCICTSYAQDYKKNIEKRFDEFYNLIARNNIEQAVEYIPDSFFTVIPKAQMIVALKSVMNNKELDYKILDYKILEIKDAKLIDKNYYAVLTYTSNIAMKFRQVDSLETTEKKKQRLGLLKLSLANTFGTDNVKLDEATNFFMITARKKSCGVSADGLNGWKFVNIESRQRLLLDKVLPKEIVETL
ncbi:MAG: hypothetical protein WC743_07475 [Mucilaginibacter sp.]